MITEDLLCKTIEKRMDDLGISRYKLAEITGQNRSTLSRFLNRESSTSTENLLSIFDALDLDLRLAPRPESKRNVGLLLMAKLIQINPDIPPEQLAKYSEGVIEVLKEYKLVVIQ